MDAEELAHIFLIARHLKTLSLQAAALNPLTVRAICWWAVARKADDRLALEQQIKQDGMYSMRIDVDHFDIVRAESLLSEVKSLLVVDAIDCVYGKESGFVKEDI